MGVLRFPSPGWLCNLQRVVWQSAFGRLTGLRELFEAGLSWQKKH